MKRTIITFILVFETERGREAQLLGAELYIESPT